jgi:hypothetical protein
MVGDVYIVNVKSDRKDERFFRDAPSTPPSLGL